MLTVENLTVRYGDTSAVRGLTFALQKGESVGIVGESGSGKTQTALALLGLTPAGAELSGSIRLDDTELLGADARTLDAVRATRIAMVFQDPMQALNPYVRVGKQLVCILEQHDIAEGHEARRRVIDMFERVGLPDPASRFRSFAHELSGGMRQRVMIAAALVTEPDLLVADEPTTALDVTVQAQILELLEDLRHDTALLLISHDLGVVAGHCERMLVLQDGALVESGRTLDVYASPQHAHTKALLAAAPRIDTAEAPVADVGEVVFSVENAEVWYGSKRDRLRAVHGVDLAVHRGETVAVVGESGCGKSSLLRAALGLVPLQSGRAVYCGEPLAGAAAARSKAARRGLQLVFQDPVGSLNPQLRIGDIIAEPLQVHEPQLPAAQVRDRVRAMLARAGLDESFVERYPHELSGGEAQRAAIARALMLEPDVLFCDEAVAALDGTVRRRILALLRDLQRDTGLAIVFITHDLSVVRVISHRVLVMYLGGLVEGAANDALFTRPRHPYTRALLDAVPMPDPTHAGGVASLRGEIPSAMQPPAGCPFHPRCPHAVDICRSERPVTRDVDGTSVACHRAEELDLAPG